MYGRVSPEATVETISLGTPTGSARAAAAPIEEFPEPPTQRKPSSRPSACRRRTTSAAPRHIASTAAPRSPAARSAARSAPAARATSSCPTSASICGSKTPASTSSTSTPCSRSRSRRYPYSAPFVSSVPRRTTVAMPFAILLRRCRPPGRSRVVVLAGGELRLLAVRDRDERAVPGERDAGSVQRPVGLDRVDRGGRHPLRRAPGDRHRVDLVLRAARAALEGEGLAVRRPRGGGADVAEVGDAADVGAVVVHHVDLFDRVPRPPVVVGDQPSVGAVGRVGRCADARSHAPGGAAALAYPVDRALAGEDDPAAVGR